MHKVVEKKTAIELIFDRQLISLLKHQLFIFLFLMRTTIIVVKKRSQLI